MVFYASWQKMLMPGFAGVGELAFTCCSGIRGGGKGQQGNSFDFYFIFHPNKMIFFFLVPKWKMMKESQCAGEKCAFETLLLQLFCSDKRNAGRLCKTMSHAETGDRASVPSHNERAKGQPATPRKLVKGELKAHAGCN